jgi:hypothetical protein
MKEKRNIIKAEFHCHTVCSFDSSNKLSPLLKTARQRGIQKLCITDHNTIRCALKAKEMAPDLVVVGEEVLTERGEILAYFLQEEIPMRLSPMETIERMKAQGAFISIPHPFDVRRHGWKLDELLSLLPHVDALEVFNARCLRGGLNEQALAFAQEQGMPMLAGSDAHSLVELGLASVELPDFNSADELRAVVKEAHISGRLLSVKDHFKASLMIGLGRLNPWKH